MHFVNKLFHYQLKQWLGFSGVSELLNMVGVITSALSFKIKGSTRLLNIFSNVVNFENIVMNYECSCEIAKVLRTLPGRVIP